MKTKIVSCIILFVFFACSSNQETIDNNIEEETQYNLEGKLLEGVIDENLNSFEFFIYNESNLPKARILSFKNTNYPTEYNDLKNKPIKSGIIHYYIYGNQSNKIIETRIFDNSLASFYYKDGKVYDDNDLDITNVRNMYEKVMHIYTNGILSKLIIKDINEEDYVFQNFHFDANKNIIGIDYDYTQSNNNDFKVDYSYVGDKVYLLDENGDLKENYYSISPSLNPYFKLFESFGLATPLYASSGRAYPPFNKFFKKYPENFLFVSSSTNSYFVNKNRVLEVNKFNYPIKTLHEGPPSSNLIPRTELIYTYLKE
ncbi:hypothetical protein [Tenacibaculum amylolyticum]|uniref:hypothetical protein n=1 Tax=Tenacibaculum amylolyticum TaxID=104269 RepID=UPI00389514C2